MIIRNASLKTQAIETAIERLARMYSSGNSSQEIKLQALRVIDQAASLIGEQHRELPNDCVLLLESATQAASHGDTPRVLHQVQFA